MSNPYWENVCAIAERQRAKGIATYGQGIEMNPADVITRIESLQEELVDALMYCEWIKDSIVDTVEVVRCKDCKHSDYSGCSGGVLYCMENSWYMDENGFCTDGERGNDG